MNQKEVEQVRAFNRFYTGILGLLDRHILDSPFSLPEARVLYELAHHEPCSATILLSTIGMDKGYLSRVLKSFIKKGLVEKARSKTDGRAAVLRLTSTGRTAFRQINEASIRQLNELFDKLDRTQSKEALRLMERLKKILETHL